MPEIIWNFGHFEGDLRLGLAHNPQFYEDLPISSVEYGGRFYKQSTTQYQGTIYILTNNSHRVFLKFDGKLRAFDNVSVVNNTLILKSWFLFVFSFLI